MTGNDVQILTSAGALVLAAAVGARATAWRRSGVVAVVVLVVAVTAAWFLWDGLRTSGGLPRSSASVVLWDGSVDGERDGTA